MVNKRSPIDRIIRKFGGMPALQRALGHRNRSTIQGWKDRGGVPAGQHAELLEAAHRFRVTLSPEDFVCPACGQQRRDMFGESHGQKNGAATRERASAP
jgi:hypothetical protein